MFFSEFWNANNCLGSKNKIKNNWKAPRNFYIIKTYWTSCGKSLVLKDLKGNNVKISALNAVYFGGYLIF